mgnify:CR=1 FL=1
MTSKEIEQNLRKLVSQTEEEGEPIDRDFLLDVLLAYGISKSSVTRLRNGSFNRSRVEGEILYGEKLFFTTAPTGELLAQVERYATEERILKHRPRFVLLTDGRQIAGKDLKTGESIDIDYLDLPDSYLFLLPLIGGEVYKQQVNNEADRNAAYELAKLYDRLLEDNPHLREGHSHELNLFLARLLFCFFAEDTGIFETPNIFTSAITQNTQSDGSGVDLFLHDLFVRLNTHDEDAGALPRYVRDFPYVNGGLFREDLEVPRFSRRSRDLLLGVCTLKWSEINPDIFGSMIQAVSDPEERGHLGMHYTSVENILRVIRPLFLDELYQLYERYRDEENEKGLHSLIERMRGMKFFDPACGSGNFLIITYKELRLLEIKILLTLIDLEEKRGVQSFHFSAISLDQFYGIEIKDFAHEIAMLSLWLAEHQMNGIFMAQLEEQGRLKPFLPLREAGHIIAGNAAQLDWTEVCPRTSTSDEIYLIGNPPYSGSRKQGKEQKADMERVFHTDYKSMDYIAIWFYKGARYIEGHPNMSLAFVSTNSICQGLMVGLTWPRVLGSSLEIHFAYNSYKWTNNAIGNAGVTVVIIGLRNLNIKAPKFIYSPEGIKKEVKNINAYLIDGPEIIVNGQTKPISKLPTMYFGNMPNDGGNLLFTSAEYRSFCTEYPKYSKYIKKFIGGSDFIDGRIRYTLDIGDEELKDALQCPEVAKRLDAVKLHRLRSSEKSTQAKASTPHKFYFTAYQPTEALLIPATSSERRDYIPIGVVDQDTIISNSAMAVYDPPLWLFGILHSRMHMVWVDAVGGKLETRYRYSAKLCYNTFPLPELSKQRQLLIEFAVREVLSKRGTYEAEGKSIAWMYDPDTMPDDLREAHHELDLAVDRCFSPTPFESDSERLEALFERYEEMINSATLFAKPKRRRKRSLK